MTKTIPILVRKGGEWVEEQYTPTDEELAAIEAEEAAGREAARRDEVERLKAQLAESDYKAIKYAEGWISAEDYAPIKAERQALRDQINAMENQ